MRPFICPTDQLIIEPLTQSINYFHAAHGTSALHPLPPTVEQLKELLDCSYAASLETEEGRCVAFTLSFFGDQQCISPYCLREPLPLSAGDLAHLAVALDPFQARICVAPRNNYLAIMGIIHLGEQEPFYGARHTLPHFSIRVIGPGILLARYADTLLFTYRRGTFAFHAGVSVSVEQHAIGTLLSLRRRPGNIESLQETLGFEAALIRIARTMLRQRHGGTLLIVPDEVNWESAASSKRFVPNSPVTSIKDARIRHRQHTADRSEALRRLQQGQAHPEMAVYWSDEMRRSYFGSQLDWLGRLTATDGMTLIASDLTLLGFGVFFDTKEQDGSPTQVRVIDPYSDETGSEPRPLASVGGARHQSAVVTCRRFPGASAVVTSQDGGLSSVRLSEKDDVVVVYRHLELLLDV
jgi:hypothetical protein